jgi:hypothetical protein
MSKESAYIHYRKTMEDLVLLAGGTVDEGLFVTKPGVAIIEVTEPTSKALEIYKSMNIHLDEAEENGHLPNSYLSSGEFKARIT